MQNVLIVGAGKGGKAILKMLMEAESLKIAAIADLNPDAIGIQFAKDHNIKTGTDWKKFLTANIDVVIEATGIDEVFEEIREKRSKKTVLIPGSVAHIIANLIDEKEELILELTKQSYLQDIILNSTHDGMLAVNKEYEIILLNESAERMVEVKKQNVLGRKVHEVFPSSELPRIIQTKQLEVNQEVFLTNGKKAISTRIPMVNDQGEVEGAFSVFKDITEVVSLAEELTNLKDIRTMLEAIIQSSEEAISVVDENGMGIMINPAYTRLTGLSKKQVIGKPASIDISEGESVHMKVLQTRKPIRGVRIKVGPAKRDVIVNVAPVIVDGKLKGSIGVIHDVSEIQSLTNELKRARQIIRTLEAKYTFDDIIGSSEEMQFAIEQAKLGARTPATVLLRGESGTGKELFAHAIHNGSDRKYNKFIRVNCAAISESLLESELFGYEEGAFSGASRGGKRGLFEEANNGSIFLDEIGELSLNTQAKLLRVLQENEIVRVGATEPIEINVRVIAATNVNLEKGIAEGTIREDLYYRLNRLPIQVPPLRKRKEDIPKLCAHLIRKINQDYGRNIEGLTDTAITVLSKYNWPGNVRELENILGRAVINMNFNEVVMDIQHIPALVKGVEEAQNVNLVNDISDNDTLPTMVEKYERSIILSVLKQHKGNKTKTAKTLGISIRNFYYKMDKLKIDHDQT